MHLILGIGFSNIQHLNFTVYIYVYCIIVCNNRIHHYYNYAIRDTIACLMRLAYELIYDIVFIAMCISEAREYERELKTNSLVNLLIK